MYPNTNISRCLVLNHDNRYNSLTPTLFIEMSVPSQENESVMYLCIRGLGFVSFYDFGI